MLTVNRHYRQTIRLPDNDYATDGLYYVTMCSYKQRCLFGDIANTEVRLSAFGKIVSGCWCAIPTHFDGVELGDYIVMPNHFHGIVILSRTRYDVGAKHSQSNVSSACIGSIANASPLHPPLGTTPGSLGAIVQSFKSVTTR